MARILVLFAHPALETSRVHSQLIRQIPIQQNITFHDLYEIYPDFHIDIDREQQLLLSHDIIILQHPLYWYSVPPIIKQWLDLVLEHGWAYGATGTALAGKVMMQAITSGGSFDSYNAAGKHKQTLPEYLAAFENTARICNMNYWPPFVVHGTHRISDTDIQLHATQYKQMLLALAADRISAAEREGCFYLNDLFPIPSTIQS